MTCTFFGQRDTPQDAFLPLQGILIDLIENHQADTFYIGNQGNFDNMVRRSLQWLQRKYPHITYAVVLAYRPSKQVGGDLKTYSDTIYPAELVGTPPKFAISKRNRWLVEHSDTVITYVHRSHGGAAQYEALARSRNKTVINVAKTLPSPKNPTV